MNVCLVNDKSDEITNLFCLYNLLKTMIWGCGHKFAIKSVQKRNRSQPRDSTFQTHADVDATWQGIISASNNIFLEPSGGLHFGRLWQACELSNADAMSSCIGDSTASGDTTK